MRRALNIILTIALTIGFVLLGVFVFRSSYIRLGYAFKDFGLSVAYYFCVMFNIRYNITPTVNFIPDVQTPQVTLPTDFNGFKNNTAQYFSLLISGDNFNAWLAHISLVMADFGKILVIILPCIAVLILIIRALYKRANNKHGKDTVLLRIFKGVSRVTYQPVKRFVMGYVAFIQEHSWIWISWVFIWILNFNLATIVIEFLAYYFYFAIEFDFSTIYTQFVKLFADLKTPFIYFPYWSLLFIIYPLFDRFRKRIATAR